MSRSQLSILFVCSLVLWVYGNGTLPLLPVYATRLGASPVFTGYYLAFAFLSLTLGTVSAGWLSDRLQRRRSLLLTAGVLTAPVIWMMGQVTDINQLAILTAANWFLCGVQLTMLRVIAGLFAEESERGRVFGILGMAGPLGGLLGGLTVGSVAGRWGYPTMFLVLALWLLLFPLLVLLLQDTEMEREREALEPAVEKVSVLQVGLLLLLSTGLMTSVANQSSILGRSLAMNTLGFPPGAITSTVAVGGIVSLPLPPLIGWLSDRMGRKRLLAICYLLLAMGLLVLGVSNSLWHYWAVVSLVHIGSFASTSVGQAMVTDVVAQGGLGFALSLYGASGWVGGIVGHAATGHAIEALGMQSTFTMGALLCVMAAFLLVPIRETRQRQPATA